MGINDGQVAFLDYFCDNENKFEYAVMIDAPWGSGKTVFLKSYLRSKYPAHDVGSTSPPDYLWVSLFGRTNATEVREALFASAYPLLSSKWGALAGNVASGLLRKYAGVDTDKEVAKQFLLDVKAKLIVFDDLERSSIGPKDALGLINSFLEDGNFKVIVIANQAPFAEDKEYRLQKEKVVGRTLTIMADPEEVLNSLAGKLRNVRARDAVIANRDDLLAVFRASGYHNFRSLRAGLDDFDRLVEAADARLASSPEALRALLLYLIAVGMEIRADTVQGERLDDFLNAAGRLVSSPNPGDAAVEGKTMIAKYPSVDWRNPLVAPKVLGALIASGLLLIEDVNACLLAHPLIVGSKQVPTWLALWKWTRQTASEYTAARDDLLAKLAANEVVHPGELLQVIGILLSISDFGDSPVSDMENYFRGYVDSRAADRTLVADMSVFDTMHADGWAGYGYQNNDNPIFLELNDYIRTAVKSVQKVAMAGKAADLLLRLPTPGAERDLYECSREANQVGGIPLLQNIALGDFADLILRDWHYDDRIMGALVLRYQQGRGYPDLADEDQWLLDLEAELRNRQQAAPAPFSKLLSVRTDYWFSQIRPAIAAIKRAGRP